jgi:hypothetical protein
VTDDAGRGDHRAPIPPQIDAAQRRGLLLSRRLARMLDTRWQVGGLRFGLDVMLEVIPVVGALVSAAMAVFQFRVAVSLRASMFRLTRMLTITLISTLIGLIPIVGLLFNLWYKPHARNQRIIEGHVTRLDARVPAIRIPVRPAPSQPVAPTPRV